MELTPEILREALRRYDEIEMSKVPNEEDIHFEFSPEFEEKMERFIEKVERGELILLLVYNLGALTSPSICACIGTVSKLSHIFSRFNTLTRIFKLPSE